MNRSIARALFLLGIGLAAGPACAANSGECPPAAGVALQVLGSGGPIADDGRASSGYVVWVDGRSRVLIDAGGGTFLRFGEAGASFADLDFVGLSHFHTDHSADFVALLKSGNFSGRQQPLTVAGPDGRGRFPGLRRYLDALLAGDGGAYGYLAGYLDGSGRLALLRPVEVDAGGPASEEVFRSADGEITVDAMHVPHGIVPALGFRVRVGGQALVFASDQNGSDERFVDFARHADLLVMHMPIPENATGAALQLHARPGRIAEIAAAADADALLLSHFMARSLRDLDGNVAAVREGFAGPVAVAADLGCTVLAQP